MADTLVIATAIGAAVAIVQPWAIAAWNRFVRQGKVETYESSSVEVGFGPLGPTVTIGGTFRALHRDMFISKMELDITRAKDSATHRLEWAVFRPHSIPLGPVGQQPVFIEIASGFMISVNAPRRVQVVFADLSTLREMAAPIGEAHAAFADAKSSLGVQNLAEQLRYGEQGAMSTLAALRETYRNDARRVEAYARLTRACYWQAGDYRMSMTLFSADPDRRFHNRWEFALTDDDAKRLELNVLNILDMPVNAETGLAERPLFFVYVPLLKPTGTPAVPTPPSA